MCPILIGREAPLAAIERIVERAAQGHGDTITLAGEAGVGKTRMVREIRGLAQEHGMLVLQGNSFDQDRMLPYGPILDLFRSFTSNRSPEELRQLFGTAVGEVVKLVPELEAVLPDVKSSPVLEPQQEKRKLFIALTTVLRRLMAEQPLAIIFEDLHWTDDVSLDFLLHLASQMHDQPAVMVMTYREDEVNEALAHFLSELDRQRLATEFNLSPLTLAETGVMLSATLNIRRNVPRDLVESIYELAEGNPFFVEEVLKALVTSGDVTISEDEVGIRHKSELKIPRSTYDAVRRRIENLTPRSLEVLDVAAVTGRRFDFELLQALMGMQPAEVLQALKELVGAQLVTEESAGRFIFRHALIQQAIYSRLLALERRELHRKVAETIEMSSLEDDSNLEDLAYHFFEAAVWDKAYSYALRAGEKAQALFSPRAAIEQFTRALEACRHVSRQTPPSLLLARAHAYEITGAFDNALADQEQALKLAREGGDAESEWQALLDLGMLWASRDYSKTGAYYQEALELARKMHSPSNLARTLNRVGNWYANTDEIGSASAAHEEALEIFERLYDSSGIAETHDLLGMSNLLGGDLIGAHEHYQHAADLLERAGDRQGLASTLTTIGVCGYTYHSNTIVPAITLKEAEASCERAFRIAREIGWRSGESFALWCRAMAVASQGEFARALDDAQIALNIAEEIQHYQWMTGAKAVIGRMFFDLFALKEAEEQLAVAFEMAKKTGSGHWIGTCGGYLTSVSVRQGRFDLAQAAIEDSVTERTGGLTVGQRRARFGQAELAIAQRDYDTALRILEALASETANLSSERVVPELWMLRAEALLPLNRAEEAERLLLDAAKTAEEVGARYILWQIHLLLGRTYSALNRLDEAEAHFNDAVNIVGEIAAKIPEGGLRDGFLRTTAGMFPTHRPEAAAASAKRSSGGLTAREREVAVRVAKGLSNAAIAEELVISERTVESHISSILSKLGFGSRAQIAAWAVETDLTSGT